MIGLFMCRIVSIFLFQRLKGSISDHARYLNNLDTRAVIKFLSPLLGKPPKEIHAFLTETLREYSPSYATIKNMVAQFKRDDFSTCYMSRPGLPKTVTTPEIIDETQALILEDPRISAESIVEQLGIYVSGLGPSFMKIST